MSDRLEEIKGRLAKATPGPWKAVDDTSGPVTVDKTIVIQAPPDLDMTADGIKLDAPEPAYSQPAYIVCETDDAHSDGRWGTWQANAEFIARAPEDIGWLISEVERFRG